MNDHMIREMFIVSYYVYEYGNDTYIMCKYSL